MPLGDDLGNDGERNFFGAHRTDVESNRRSDLSQLFFGDAPTCPAPHTTSRGAGCKRSNRRKISPAEGKFVAKSLSATKRVSSRPCRNCKACAATSESSSGLPRLPLTFVASWTSSFAPTF